MNISPHIKTILNYVLLCSLSFIISFTFLTPIKVIQNIFLPSEKINQFSFSQLNGNIWQGSLHISYLKNLSTKIQWTIRPSNFFTNKSVTNITLSTAGSQLQLSSNFQELSPEFKLRGTLDSHEISSQLHLAKRAKMTGLIHIKNLTIKNKPPYFVDQLNIKWLGGLVSAGNNNNQLPALNIQSSQENNALVINITEAENKQILLKIIATANKQAEIKMTQQLLTLTKQGNLSDDKNEFVIRFTEKLKF